MKQGEVDREKGAEQDIGLSRSKVTAEWRKLHNE
jgi:hypothetical protein